MKVFLVDDDVDLADLLAYALQREGFTVSVAIDGQQALNRWEAENADVILLDGNLPKVDGFEVCRRIRHEAATPIIMLTARDDEQDVLRGFTYGADDYVPKPFSAKQLVARIKAVLRRSQTNPFKQVASALKIGDLELDVQSHGVLKGGTPVSLTPLEFRILHMLATNVGRVVPYSRLVEYAWGYYNEHSSGLLKSHISHVRRKLRLPASGPGTIKAVLGVGYSLQAADAHARSSA